MTSDGSDDDRIGRATGSDDGRVGRATGRFRTRHDGEGDGSVAVAVVRAVAAVTGAAPTDVQPLYEVVDPDALDELVAALREDGYGEVRFVLDGCEVTIGAGGVIELRPLDPNSI